MIRGGRRFLEGITALCNQGLLSPIPLTVSPLRVQTQRREHQGDVAQGATPQDDVTHPKASQCVSQVTWVCERPLLVVVWCGVSCRGGLLGPRWVVNAPHPTEPSARRTRQTVRQARQKRERETDRQTDRQGGQKAGPLGACVRQVG